MKLIPLKNGLLFLSGILLLTISCKKKFNAESDTANETLNKEARIASVQNYLTDQSAINLFDIVFNYAGYGPKDEPDKKQFGYKRLSEAANNGFKVIRFFAGGARDNESQILPAVQLWKDNKAAFFEMFDKLVADAGSLGIQLVPVLVTGYSDPDELTRASNAPENLGKNVMDAIPFLEKLTVTSDKWGTQTLDCIKNPEACKNRSELRQFALDIVSRYKNSNTILYWEIGNEINLTAKRRTENSSHKNILPDFNILRYIIWLSADIKAIDPIHMIDGGIVNEGTDQEVNDFVFYYYLNENPNVDIASVHPYEPDCETPPCTVPYDQSPAFILPYFVNTIRLYGKVPVIGETGVNAAGWAGNNNFNNYVMSMMLAKTYLNVPLLMPWTWESTKNGGYESTSLDPGEDDDAISILNRPVYRMGDNNIQFSYPITGDFNGDGHDDFGVKTDRGLWQLSLVNDFNAAIPSQWLGPFGDKKADPGGAPYIPVTGDWDGDGDTDIGFKSKDGRWYVAFSDRDNHQFSEWALWLSNYGNDNSDPGGAPFEPITGDWDGDGYTDIGFRAKDGRWYTAINDYPNPRFTNLALWLTGMGNDYTEAGGPFQTVTADWDGDGDTDIGVKGKNGQWRVALSLRDHFSSPEVWSPSFGDDSYDPGGAPFIGFTGYWNNDNKADIGIKSKDGRWYVMFSDPLNHRFTNPAQWYTGIGNDYADPGSAPSIPITGDWDNDGKTDIGIKANDGRWYGALNTGNSFYYQKTFF